MIKSKCNALGVGGNSNDNSNGNDSTTTTTTTTTAATGVGTEAPSALRPQPGQGLVALSRRGRSPAVGDQVGSCKDSADGEGHSAGGLITPSMRFEVQVGESAPEVTDSADCVVKVEPDGGGHLCPSLCKPFLLDPARASWQWLIPRKPF